VDIYKHFFRKNVTKNFKKFENEFLEIIMCWYKWIVNLCVILGSCHVNIMNANIVGVIYQQFLVSVGSVLRLGGSNVINIDPPHHQKIHIIVILKLHKRFPIRYLYHKNTT